jgi:hypothetical protein
MMSSFDEFPIPWKTAFLAVTPGLLAVFGLVNGDFTVWMLLGGILLSLLVGIAWMQNGKQLPGWSLMAAGVLLGMALPVVLAGIGVPIALVAGTESSPGSSLAISILPWIGIVVLSLRLRQDVQFSPRTWLLMAAIVASSILVRVKYFILFGTSWSILWEMLGISLWAAGTLLLPIIAGGYLARRHGVLTILFAVGATFAWYEVLIDNAGRVDASIDSPVLFWMYQLIVQLLFVVVGPWLFLRAKEAQGQLRRLVIPVCASVVINIVVSGMVRGDFTPIIWLSAIPYTVSIALSMTLAYWLYWSAGKGKRCDPDRGTSPLTSRWS